MENIITIRDLHLPINYLELNQDVRKALCTEIIIKAFAAMTVKASKAQRIKVMQSVLQHSLEYSVEVERYEDSQIFFDLQQVLKEEIIDKT